MKALSKDEDVRSLRDLREIIEDRRAKSLMPLRVREAIALCEYAMRLQQAVTWAYQAIAAQWPNENALDNLSAVLDGKQPPHEWPVVPPRDL